MNTEEHAYYIIQTFLFWINDFLLLTGAYLVNILPVVPETIAKHKEEQSSH